jgi:DNA replication protein
VAEDQAGRTSPFAGFPSSGKAVLVPEPFFLDVLPAIQNMDELRVTLLLFWAVQQRRGMPRTVSETELRRNAEMLQLLNTEGLDQTLALVVARGTFLCAVATSSSRRGTEERYYLLNTPAERRALVIQGSNLQELPPTPTISSRERNIFQLYEENIGPLTPMLAEELRDAEQQYPFAWLEEAFQEALALNHRNWRYVRRILERWSKEGRDEQSERVTPRRIRSRYDHLIRR